MVSILGIQKVRDAVTKTAKLLARDKVEIRQAGAQPHVAYGPDGKVLYVNLPVIPDNPPEEFLLAVQGFLDHEVAHVLFTNAVELRTATDRASAAGMNPDATAKMCNVIEDIRIERAMTKEFAGSAYNLSHSLLFVLDKKILPQVEKAKSAKPGFDQTVAMISAAFVAWARARSGDNEATAFMDRHDLWPHFMLIELVFPTFEERLAALSSSRDAADLAFEFLQRMMPPPSKPEEPPPPEEGDGDEGDGEGEGEDKGDGDGDGGIDHEGVEEDDTPDEKPEEVPEIESPEKPIEEDDTADEDAPEPEDDGDDDDDSEEEDDDAEEDGEDSDEDGDDEEGQDDKADTNMPLSKAMKMLDPDQRRALFLYNNRRKTVRAVAETMTVSEERVSDLLKSGRRNLKKLMGKG